MTNKQVLIKRELHRPAKVKAASEGLTLMEYLSALIEKDLDLDHPKTQQPPQAA